VLRQDPLQTFLDSAPLAREKTLASFQEQAGAPNHSATPSLFRVFDPFLWFERGAWPVSTRRKSERGQQVAQMNREFLRPALIWALSALYQPAVKVAAEKHFRFAVTRWWSKMDSNSQCCF